MSPRAGGWRRDTYGSRCSGKIGATAARDHRLHHVPDLGGRSEGGGRAGRGAEVSDRQSPRSWLGDPAQRVTHLQARGQAAGMSNTSSRRGASASSSRSNRSVARPASLSARATLAVARAQRLRSAAVREEHQTIWDRGGSQVTGKPDAAEVEQRASVALWACSSVRRRQGSTRRMGGSDALPWPAAAARMREYLLIGDRREVRDTKCPTPQQALAERSAYDLDRPPQRAATTASRATRRAPPPGSDGRRACEALVPLRGRSSRLPTHRRRRSRCAHERPLVAAVAVALHPRRSS